MSAALTAQTIEPPPTTAQARAAGEAALAHLEDEQRAEHWRRVLDADSPLPQVTRALSALARERDPADLPRVLSRLGSLEPTVAHAALEALRAYGPRALAALEAPDAAGLDQAAVARAKERLLLDHILSCCRRDQLLNPLGLPYSGRFDELYSVPGDVDDAIFRLVRDALPDVRADLRMQYQARWGEMPPFITWGALAVDALGERRTELLKAELSPLSQQDWPDVSWANQRQPVTLAVAAFLAREGQEFLADKLIHEMETSRRGGNPDWTARFQFQIAALEYTAFGRYASALARVTQHVSNLREYSGQSQGHYLHARLQAAVGDRAGALRALEAAIESGDEPPLLLLADDAFAPLAGERRYGAILRYCELAARRVSPQMRPWSRQHDEE
jgi:hypothetical protein